MIGDDVTNQRIGLRNHKIVFRSICSFVSTFVNSYTERKTRGFTLMEMLVALAIFSTVVTIATDIFFSYQRTQRKTEELQKVVSAARFVSEAIVREVKEGTIDYAYSGYARSDVNTLSNPQIVLALKDAEGRVISFEKSSSDCPDALSTPCITLSADSRPESLTPRGVQVNALQFYIAPSQDPYGFDTSTGAFFGNEQPRVTIFMSLKDSAGRTKYDLQTTVVSRMYKR